MVDVVIYGAGSVGRLVEQIIFDINRFSNEYNLIGYLDDNIQKENTKINELFVLGGIDWLLKNPNVSIALGFSNPLQKLKLVNKLKLIGHSSFVSLLHPSAWISQRVKIGTGVVIYPGVLIDVDVSLSDFILINKACTIGHDTIIGSYTTLAPGVNIGGRNFINEGAEFGINSCSIQGLNIGQKATIGAGAVIIHDVPDFAVVVGNPGRVIKYMPVDERPVSSGGEMRDER